MLMDSWQASFRIHSDLFRTMQKITHISLLTLVLLISILGRSAAQSITNYNFSAYSNTFSNLSGSIIPPSSGDTNEGYANGIPLGFDFWYMGVRYTSVSASSNGWLALGGNITNASPVNNLTSGSLRPILAPLWDDLNVQAAANVTYLTSGTSGSRILSLMPIPILSPNILTCPTSFAL